MEHSYVLHSISGRMVRVTASLMHISPRSSILTGIEVEKNLRGRGYGTALLKKVLEDADRLGVILLLSVASDDSPRALTNEQLQAWYARHGFMIVPGKTGNGTTMQRLPNKETT
jgi:GNAT superfamily N-acetyltransferase